MPVHVQFAVISLLYSISVDQYLTPLTDS